MKKISHFILTGLLIVLFNACAKDSNSSTPVETKSVTVTIDGIPRNFNNIQVIQEPWTDSISGTTKVDLHIKAINVDDVTEYIHFGIGKGDLGEGQLWDFGYVKNGTDYTSGSAGIYDMTTSNIEKRIKGSFNGQVSSNGVNRTFTNGIFDISY